MFIALLLLRCHALLKEVVNLILIYRKKICSCISFNNCVQIRAITKKSLTNIRLVSFYET